MEKCIVIKGLGVISPMGASLEEVRTCAAHGAPQSSIFDVAGQQVPVFSLHAQQNAALTAFAARHPMLQKVDRCVQFAAFAAQQAFNEAGWQSDTVGKVGIFVGSSRGATRTLERAIEAFLEQGCVKEPKTSPLTTLGNVSSTIAQLLHIDGVHSSHSITCSTALHAVLNAVAWLRSGMISKAIVGGSEAPLSAFTVAQMQSLGIYSPNATAQWPCRPLERDAKGNSFVLGEGAACFALELLDRADVTCGDIVLNGFGFSTERIPSLTGMSKEGKVFQQTMKDAVRNRPVSCLVVHAPGTIVGDRAELYAAETVFETLPVIQSNKMFQGHTFAASGAFNIVQALHLLRGGSPLEFPYETVMTPVALGVSCESVLVNAAGFGGNAVSLLFEKHSA